MKFILGKKLGMTQVFDKTGRVIPITLIKAGPCQVVQVKTKQKDGYQAVQIGFEEIKEKKVAKPQKGHFKKAGLEKNFRYLREFRESDLKTGHKIDVSIFNEGEIVKIAGVSKGKGFQGVVKRYGFKGSPATHGTKHSLRSPGSIGSAFPQRVWKGKKMAGRMGNDRITIQGLKIIQVDKENDLLAVKGAVPGRKGLLLEMVVTKEIAVVKEEEKEKLIADLKKKEAEAKEKSPRDESVSGQNREAKEKEEKKEETGKEKEEK